MADKVEFRDLGDTERRGVNIAGALAREQLKYARAVAQEMTPPGQEPDAVLVGALVQAIATNYAAVK